MSIAQKEMVPYFALFYEVVDDFPNKRTPFRADHRQHVQAALDRDELLMAGAFCEPADGAMLIFRSPDRSAPENFAKADPYVERPRQALACPRLESGHRFTSG